MDQVFGVDLLLSFPPQFSPEAGGPPCSKPAIPTVTLLEYNASPDFQQSGDRLRPHLLEMFKGVIRISIAPFFGIDMSDEDRNSELANDEATRKMAWEVGEERWSWRLVGRGEVRGSGG